jgi:NAD(P)-dependent dehydrogenase (short-subunit alcohol dehydrogenase family)
MPSRYCEGRLPSPKSLSSEVFTVARDSQVSVRAAEIRPHTHRKCLVMTGGTSGIGRRALEQILADRPGWDIILFARQSPRLDTLRALPHGAERLVIVDADLTSLASVNHACDAILGRLGARSIDVLALNAGIQTVTGDVASADGLELAFAVNFLAHFLIVERLRSKLRPGSRIVSTSSEVHDPQAFCLLGIGRATWQDPLVLADPKRSQAHVASVVDRGEARYCASKLLNLMHVRQLASDLTDIGVIAFNPSVVPGTEIGRDRNWLQQLGWKYVMPALAPILPGARVLAQSAGDLLWLLTDADARALTGQYVDGRTVRPGSEESRDPVKIARAMDVARTLLARHASDASAA